MIGLNLRDIERRSWRATLDGGLIEILFGIMMFGASASYVLSDAGASSSICLAALAGVQGGGLLLTFFLRRQCVAPRIGRAVFSPNRKRRLLHMRVLLGATVVCTLALVVLTATAGRSSTLSPTGLAAYGTAAVISAVVLLPLSALAYFLDFPKFLLLGIYIAAAEFALARFDAHGGAAHDEAIVYAVLGAIGSTIGWVTFVRFLRRVPRADREEVAYEE